MCVAICVPGLFVYPGFLVYIFFFPTYKQKKKTAFSHNSYLWGRGGGGGGFGRRDNFCAKL